jgi:hypothetical protein
MRQPVTAEDKVLRSVTELSDEGRETTQAQQWARMQAYYKAYERFLGIMARGEDFKTELNELSKYAQDIDQAMAHYKGGDDADNEKLASLWYSRQRLDKQLRDSLLVGDGGLAFARCEAQFLFSDEVARFVTRPAKNRGLARLQAEIRGIETERRELVEKSWEAKTLSPDDSAALARLDAALKARMTLYDSEETVRAAYSALARHEASGLTTTTTVVTQQALEQLFSAAATGDSDVGKRLKIRDLLLTLHEAVLALATPPVLVYDRAARQLIYEASGRPVTTLAPLHIERLVTHRGEASVAPKDLAKGEFVTSSRRLIDALPVDVDMEALLAANLQLAFLIATAGADLSASVFDRFRGVRGNCRVEHVRLEDRDVAVLVALRSVKRGARLVRDLSDSELYRAWEAHHETTPALQSTTPQQQRLRQHIAKLQVSRLVAMADKRQDDALDLKIRVHLLSNLVSS